MRFGADQGSVTLANLERTSRAALQVLGEGGLVYLIRGESTMGRPRIEAAPFPIAMMDLRVTWVKDQSWPGVEVLPLGYRWSPEHREAMQAMERAVYAELRGDD